MSLHGQLLWREFFYTASVGIPNFNKMEGNSVCTQVDWDTNPEYLAAWREVLSAFKSLKVIERREMMPSDVVYMITH